MSVSYEQRVFYENIEGELIRQLHLDLDVSLSEAIGMYLACPEAEQYIYNIEQIDEALVPKYVQAAAQLVESAR